MLTVLGKHQIINPNPKGFTMKLKEMFSNMKCKTAAIAAGVGLPMLSAGSSFAALSTDEQAMVTTITTKLTDLSTAVTTMIGSNLTLIATMIVGGFIVAYFWKAGRG
jgi:tetrahydromethanopterin S-methyltransferase subunit D